MKILKTILLILALGIFLFFTLRVFDFMIKENKDVVFGISFSPKYARSLELDPEEIYNKALTDLDFKYIRLSASWDELEKVKGVYDFSEMDKYMDLSAKNNVKVILAVGRKTPRWPECHLPDWASQEKYENYKAELVGYIKVVVERYKNHSALELWQVENEPFLKFGSCDKMSVSDLGEEISLVKKIDPSHEIMITDSGELSTWRKTAGAGDFFGTTVYRVVWNKFIGFWKYDWLPAWWYQVRLKWQDVSLDKAFVVELQAEPWMTGGSATSTALKKQEKSMSVERLKQNIFYTQKIGFPRSYLWGVEWWYWLEKNYPEKGEEFLEVARGLKKE